METLADLLYTLPVTYGLVFDVVHYIVCLQAERADHGSHFDHTTRTHPLASWFSAMLVCFAGGLLVNPLCGEPVLSAVDDPIRLLIASGLWYLMFYSPNDLAYHLTKKLPVKVSLYLLKGLYYPKKIVAGIKHARHVFGSSNVIAMLVLATVKANGSGFMKPVARFFRGSADGVATVHEVMVPSLTTKYCFVCALAYLLLPGDACYLLMAGLLVTMKMGPLFNVPVDVFGPIESSVSALAFGCKKEPSKKD